MLQKLIFVFEIYLDVEPYDVVIAAILQLQGTLTIVC